MTPNQLTGYCLRRKAILASDRTCVDGCVDGCPNGMGAQATAMHDKVIAAVPEKSALNYLIQRQEAGLPSLGGATDDWDNWRPSKELPSCL